MNEVCAGKSNCPQLHLHKGIILCILDSNPESDHLSYMIVIWDLVHAHVNWVSVTQCHVLSFNADKCNRGCGQVVL